MMNDREKIYSDILKELVKIPKMKKIMEEKNITKEMISRDISPTDQLLIIENFSNNDTPSHILTLEIDKNNKVFCKWERNVDFWKTETLSMVKPNYVYHSFPPKLLSLTKNDVKVTKESTILTKELGKWVERDSGEGNFLILKGPNKTGKTFMSIVFLNRVSSRGHSVAQIYLPDFLNHLKRLINKKTDYDDPDDISMERLLSSLKNVDYLLIDGFGEESPSQWGISEILLPLISYRVDGDSPIVITTTSSISEMKSKYLKAGINKHAIEKLLSIFNKDFKIVSI